jgi:hypothetical protein
VKFDRVYQFDVGGERVLFGILEKQETSAPQVHAAALDEHGLHHGQCGISATEAEAAADLFRYLRDHDAL